MEHNKNMLTEKENEVFRYIKKYIEHHRFSPTYKEIQTHMGYKSVGTVQDFVLQLKKKNFLESTEGKHRGIKLATHLETADAVKVPLLGAVAAGRPLEVVESSSESIEVSKSILKKSGTHFALKVKGSSMIEDCIMDGDYVVLRSQESAENGQTVVAVIDNEATIKRYYKKRNTIELHPANPDFKTRVVNAAEDFRIKGVLVGVIRKLG